MRRLLVLILALSACRQEPQQEVQPEVKARAPIVTYAGSGRDRLCLDEGARRLGFITYGEGDANCSVRAEVVQNGSRLSITPDGDQSCRIDATVGEGSLTLGASSPACAYYCGPEAGFAGKSFWRVEKGEPVADLAGDPLC